MKTKYRNHKMIKTYYKYLITKGEIGAHNNSAILKKKLKELIFNLKNQHII